MTNGAAAYDLRARRGTEAPKIDRPKLPEEKKRPQKPVRVKAKTMVSPVAVLGMTMVVFLLILVIFGYVRLYEATSELGRLQSKLDSVQQENQTLRSQYEGKIDLAEIEERAIHEVGMVQPTNSQNVYLNLSGTDRAEITQEEETGFFGTLVEACSSGIDDIMSYFFPSEETTAE